MRKKLFTFLLALAASVGMSWADPAVAVNGKLPGAFSVSATQQVYFSQGNLQYQASTNTWRFAEHQYDYVGNATLGNVYENSVKCDNAFISDSYAGWIDLFGWNTANNPTLSSENGNYVVCTCEQSYENWAPFYPSCYPFTDWGVNPISNGGNQPNLWRTLTNAEWDYLYNGRTTSVTINNISSVRYTGATIFYGPIDDYDYNDIWFCGNIIFPDTYVEPETNGGVSWGRFNGVWEGGYYEYDTHCTLAGLEILLNAGAVFVPAALVREGTTVIGGTGNTREGNYWASDRFCLDPNIGCPQAYAEVFGGYLPDTRTGLATPDYTGLSVRLVSNVPPTTPSAKTDAVVTTPPAALNRLYDASTQALIAAGEATGGTMKYSLTSGSGYSTELPTAKNAGTYTVYYMVEGDATHNDVAEASVEVTVSKVGLTVTADNKAVTCGEAAPAYTATYNGFVGGETEAVLGGTLAFACGYTTTSAAGDYTITPSGLTSDNYTITFQTGTLTASKADAEVTTPPAAVNRSYDASTQALITAGTATGGTMKYSLTSGSGYSTDLPTAKNAGTYTVYYMVEGDATHNDVAEASVEVTISKVGLTVTADNKAVTCGEAAPAYTASYSGFVGGETEAVLGGTLAFACDYTTTSAAGDYTITPSGLTSDNYTITFQTGTLTATAAAPVVVTIDVPTHQDPLNSQWYYTTFYHSTQNYALTNDATEAFVADLSGTDLVLTKIAEGEQVIPAHTGVIFRKSYSADPVVLAPTDAAGVSFTANNDLEGVDAQTDLTAIDGLTADNCYILSGQADDQSVVGVGFYRVNKSYLKEHKAYVKYVGSQDSAPRRMRFVFEQENTATGMESIQPSDVSCQKVLRDGQLIILRNGVEYNANGQIVK